MHLRPAVQLVIQLLQQHVRVLTKFLQQRPDESVRLLDECGQQMFAVDFLVIEFLRDLLR